MINLNDYSKNQYYKDIPLLKIDNDGNKSWYLNGEFHREDGPAVEYINGYKSWWVNDKRHREDGPAVEWATGSKEWYLNGELHREDGPAVEFANGTKEWFLNDQQLTEQEFNQMIEL